MYRFLIAILLPTAVHLITTQNLDGDDNNNKNCFGGIMSYEKTPGVVFKVPPSQVLIASSDQAVTPDCAALCRQSNSCLAFTNEYKTGRCQAFDRDSIGRRELLRPQIGTNYFEEVCYRGVVDYSTICGNRIWAFERITGAFLEGFDDKEEKNVASKVDCERLCLAEKSFTCRSCEYDELRQLCRLSREDRRTQPLAFKLSPASSVDYLENQCVKPTPTCRYEIKNGVNVISLDDLQYASNSNECEKTCDKTSLFSCWAFAFDNRQSRCYLSGDDTASPATDVAALPVRPGFIYGERKCISDICSNGIVTFEKITVHTLRNAVHEPILVNTVGQGVTLDCLQGCKDLGQKCPAMIIDYGSNRCLRLDRNSQGRESDIIPYSTHTYFEQICLRVSNEACHGKAWAFERVVRHEILGFDDRILYATQSRRECEEACINELGFVCRSAEYDYSSNECRLSKEDRRSRVAAFGPTTRNVDYLENQCLEADLNCRLEKKEYVTPTLVEFIQPQTRTEEDCLNACSAFRGFTCRSFGFRPNTGECLISNDDQSSARNVFSESHPETILYERTCLLSRAGISGGLVPQPPTVLGGVETNYLPTPQASSSYLGGRCPSATQGFIEYEKTTGHVLKVDLMTTLLSDGDRRGITKECKDLCDLDSDCLAFNLDYNSSECISLRRDSTLNRHDLEMTVATGYFEPVCFKARGCGRLWTFERHLNKELREQTREVIQTITKAECEERCLLEIRFPCRSAIYNHVTSECRLSTEDRFSRPDSFVDAKEMDYLENQCSNILTSRQASTCQYSVMARDRVLSFVDRVVQTISESECQRACDTELQFVCRSYSFTGTQGTRSPECYLSADTSNSVGAQLQNYPGANYVERSCPQTTVPIPTTFSKPYPGGIPPIGKPGSPYPGSPGGYRGSSPYPGSEQGPYPSPTGISPSIYPGGPIPSGPISNQYPKAHGALPPIRFPEYPPYSGKQGASSYYPSQSIKPGSYPGQPNGQPYPGQGPGQSGQRIGPSNYPNQAQYPGQSIGLPGQPLYPGQSPGQPSYNGQSPGQPSFLGQSIGQPSYPGQSIGQPSYPGQSIGQPSYPGQSIGQPSYPGQSIGQPSYPGQSIGQPPYPGQSAGQSPPYPGQSLVPPSYPGSGAGGNTGPYPPAYSGSFPVPIATCDYSSEAIFEKTMGFAIRPLGRMEPLPASVTSQHMVSDCLKACSQEGVRCQAFMIQYPFSPSTTPCVSMDRGLGLERGQLLPRGDTAYFEKLCLKEVKGCGKMWTFERVVGFQLDGNYDKEVRNIFRKEDCEEACLAETSLPCRSAIYIYSLQLCRMTSETRRTKPESFRYVGNDVDYIENQCATEPSECDYTDLTNKFNPFTDRLAVRVLTLDECKKSCEQEQEFNCRSVSFDNQNNDCYLSAEDRFSTPAGPNIMIDRPGFEYAEKGGCGQVKVDCTQTEMLVTLRFGASFNGRIYAKGNPQLCFIPGNSQTQVTMNIPIGTQCGTVEESQGRYANEIVIQQHPVIMTDHDKTYRVVCSFDMADKTLTFSPGGGGAIDVTYGIPRHGGPPPLITNTAPTPNVRLRITDRSGQDVNAVNLGDELYFRIEPDPYSAFGVFAKNLVARSEFLDYLPLLDNTGCPADPNVFPGLEMERGTKALIAPFKAFRFASTGRVNFEVQIQFCQDACQSGRCQYGNTFGRRKRNQNPDQMEELMEGLGQHTNTTQSDSTENMTTESILKTIATLPSVTPNNSEVTTHLPVQGKSRNMDTTVKIAISTGKSPSSSTNSTNPVPSLPNNSEVTGRNAFRQELDIPSYAPPILEPVNYDQIQAPAEITDTYETEHSALPGYGDLGTNEHHVGQSPPPDAFMYGFPSVYDGSFAWNTQDHSPPSPPPPPPPPSPQPTPFKFFHSNVNDTQSADSVPTIKESVFRSHLTSPQNTSQLGGNSTSTTTTTTTTSTTTVPELDIDENTEALPSEIPLRLSLTVSGDSDSERAPPVTVNEGHPVSTDLFGGSKNYHQDIHRALNDLVCSSKSTIIAAVICVLMAHVAVVCGATIWWRRRQKQKLKEVEATNALPPELPTTAPPQPQPMFYRPSSGLTFRNVDLCNRYPNTLRPSLPMHPSHWNPLESGPNSLEFPETTEHSS